MREARLLLRRYLEEAGLEDASFEAKQILRQVLAVDTAGLLTVTDLEEAQWQAALALAKKRAEGHPLQYLLGSWEFYGRSFQVGEGVLIPRADTEILCDTALQFLKQRQSPRVVDLCAGSGCIAITLERECKEAEVWALELSEVAFPYLKANIQHHQSRVHAVFDDVLKPNFRETELDLIVSNPPYLNEIDIQNLQREVQFEPKMALYAPENGLLFYRLIPEIWSGRLKSGGMLCFEVGIGQAEAVCALLQKNGFVEIEVIPDLQGISRVVCGRKK